MRNPLCKKSWSPYVVGAGIGVLSWFAFITADRPLGVSTVFEHTPALVYQAVLPQFVATNGYFEQHTPKIGWQWMLVPGIFLGALVSAWTSGDQTRLLLPELWKWRFGGGIGLRLTGAFFGGALMLFGARPAGGCTSGHGISGTLQLAASSWLFTVIVFTVGIATAFLLYGRDGRRHV